MNITALGRTVTAMTEAELLAIIDDRCPDCSDILNDGYCDTCEREVACADCDRAYGPRGCPASCDCDCHVADFDA